MRVVKRQIAVYMGGRQFSDHSVDGNVPEWFRYQGADATIDLSDSINSPLGLFLEANAPLSF